jgi:hypothetical protein
MKTLFDNLFVIGTDYKATFTEEVDKLVKQELTNDFKNKLIQALTDAYIDQTGKVPDSIELSRLATWIVEDKTNDPHKVSKTEYPILSIDQMKTRWRRETVKEDIGDTSNSGKHKSNGKRYPKNFKVFGEYEGGY